MLRALAALAQEQVPEPCGDGRSTPALVPQTRPMMAPVATPTLTRSPEQRAARPQAARIQAVPLHKAAPARRAQSWGEAAGVRAPAPAVIQVHPAKPRTIYRTINLVHQFRGPCRVSKPTTRGTLVSKCARQRPPT